MNKYVFETETTKHVTNNKKLTGAKSILSPALCEVRLPMVLRARKAVITHERIFTVLDGGEVGKSPARRQITYAKNARAAAAPILANLQPDVSTDCRPPHAVDIGRIPAAIRI